MSLDTSRALTLSALIIGELVDEAGYTIEEVVAGCIQAIIDIAGQDDELLDQAANFLADGGIVDDPPDWDEFDEWDDTADLDDPLP